MKKVTTWIATHKFETLVVAIIVAAAAFFRLYQIPQYMTFLGDEGRDARVVRRLIVDLDPVLIGPMTSITTSAGHMYLGPLYYYLMAPSMILSGLSPVGPAVMIALFSLLTIALIWWIGRTWFHPIVGITAAVLYAISPTVIIHSRSSWNPNIMPFFALLSIWSIYKILSLSSPQGWHTFKNTNLDDSLGVDKSRKTKNYQLKTINYFLILAISLAFVLQSHYLGLLLIPTVGIFWLVTLFNVGASRRLALLKGDPPARSYYSVAGGPDRPYNNLKFFLLNSVFCILLFLFLMSPLLIFDIRHDWLNFKAISAFFSQRQTTVNLKLYKGIPKLYPILEQIYNTLITANKTLVTKSILMLSGITLIINLIRINPKSQILNPKQIQIIKIKKIKQIISNFDIRISNFSLPLILLLIWLFIGILGLAVYKQHIYDHYFGFLFPAPFLLTGWIIWKSSQMISTWFTHLRKNTPGVGFDSPGVDGISLISLILITPLLYLNLTHNPLKSPPPQTLQHTQEVAQKIKEESQGQPFNLALIAKSNYDESYRYILERWKTPLVAIDPLNADQTIADQLFVICENQPPYEGRDMDCNPISHPKAEIALFGWAKIDQHWTLPWGHQLYQLSHYPE
jgi:hypothetical protein